MGSATQHSVGFGFGKVMIFGFCRARKSEVQLKERRRVGRWIWIFCVSAEVGASFLARLNECPIKGLGFEKLRG